MQRVVLCLFLLLAIITKVAAQNTPTLPPPVVAIQSKKELRHQDIIYGANIYTALGFGAGSGLISFLPTNPEPNFVNQEYTVTVNASFRYSIGASFQIRNLELGVVGGPEVYQVGEQIRRLIRSETDPAVIRNLRENRNYIWLDDNTYVIRQTNRSAGAWPRYIIHYGAFAEYNIDITRKFRLSPTVGYNTYAYFNTMPFEVGNEKEVADYFDDRHQYHAGLRIKLIMNRRAYLGFGVLRRYTTFDARDYFNDIQPDTYKQEYSQTFFEFTYTYRFWEL